mmetsp:Transcript_4660/g.13295  ORF Transcript_4660/g.13295 Transcript_4660/m.13295 type:complete len:202 (+) Transcript_4660:1608-2213(+)
MVSIAPSGVAWRTSSFPTRVQYYTIHVQIICQCWSVRAPSGVSTRPARRPRTCPSSSEVRGMKLMTPMTPMKLTGQLNVRFLVSYQRTREDRRANFPRANSSPKTRPALPQCPPALPTSSSAPPASPSAIRSPDHGTNLLDRKSPRPPVVAFGRTRHSPGSKTRNETSKTTAPDSLRHDHCLRMRGGHHPPTAPGRPACIP